MIGTWQRCAARGVGAVVLAALVGAPAWAAKHPTLHPLSERYHASSSAATGRSGSASLSLRALEGRSGTTDLEISTGDLDSGQTAPGNLRKVQVKAFDAKGALAWTRNFNSLPGGGTVDMAFTGLTRNQRLQVQANVDGIDGRRTDVVTVGTTVKLRPDLAVEHVTAPPTALVGTPVNISAAIDERNGDTGARGDCVLSIDGAEAQRTAGIWVDAGGAVTCAFSYTFASTGTHVLAVALGNISPADDNPGDDSAETSIEITQPANLVFHFSASVTKSTQETVFTTSQSVSNDDGTTTTGSDQTQQSRQDVELSYSNFSGQIDGALTFPISVAVTESSDGATVGSAAFDAMPADFSSQDGAVTTACASRYDATSGGYLYVCGQSGGDANESTVDWSRYGGTVTYFSSEFDDTWFRDDATGQTTTTGSWAYNSSSSFALGSGSWNVGSTYGFDVSVTGAGASHHAVTSFATQSFSSSDTPPMNCTTSGTGGSTLVNCSQTTTTSSGVSGSVTGSAP